MDYDLAELSGTFKNKDGEDVAWHDEDAMLAHLLLAEVCWTRGAHYIGNKGSPHEFTGDGTIALVNCNDVFAWGCADAEELPHTEIPALFMEWHKHGGFGAERWVCFRRNCKPQRPVAKAMKENGAWCDRMEALPENWYDAALARMQAEKETQP